MCSPCLTYDVSWMAGDWKMILFYVGKRRETIGMSCFLSGPLLVIHIHYSQTSNTLKHLKKRTQTNKQTKKTGFLSLWILRLCSDCCCSSLSVHTSHTEKCVCRIGKRPLSVLVSRIVWVTQMCDQIHCVHIVVICHGFICGHGFCVWTLGQPCEREDPYSH